MTLENFTAAESVLIVVNAQENLFRYMFNLQDHVRHLLQLIKGVRVYEIPIILVEQYPQGLGVTIREVRDLVGPIKAIEKLSFDCTSTPEFMNALEATGRKQAILCGCESHADICQTSAGLVRRGYTVQVVADAVTSRRQENKNIGLTRSEYGGAYLTSVEALLLEITEIAAGDKFKEISKIIK